MLLPAEASATTYTVNAWNDASSDGTCTDPWAGNANDCTLRDAIDEANANPGDDSIVIQTTLQWFDASSSTVITRTTGAEISCAGPLDDTNACGDLDAWDSNPGTTLTIIGGAVNNLIPTASADRSLHAPAMPSPTQYEVHLVVQDTSFNGGFLDFNASTQPEGGACIATASTDLTLVRSLIVGCELDATTLPYTSGAPGGGALYVGGDLQILDTTQVTQNVSRNRDGGGIDARGDVLIEESEIGGSNQVFNNGVGGGLVVRGGTASVSILRSTVRDNIAPLAGGGAWLEPGELQILDSELDNNSAFDGGGVFLVGYTHTAADPMVERSTFVDNTAAYGGGMHITGPLNGAVNNSMVVHNSTFSANQYDCGSSGCNGGGIYLDGGQALTLDLEHVTFVGNTQVGGGAIGEPVWNAGGTHTVTAVNTIFEGDCVGSVSSLGGNWTNTTGAGTPICGWDVTVDVDTPNPLIDTPLIAGTSVLQTLAYVAPGLTRVHDVVSGPNQANDQPLCVPGIASDDQRGVSRVIGTDCDLGAVER